MPPDEIPARKQANAAVEKTMPNDVLVTGYVDYATALIPAMLGAGFEYNQDTSWAIPKVNSIQEVAIGDFDPSQPLFQAYLERVEKLLEGWSWETYLPATYAYLGPLDVLAGLLGAEQLSIDLYEHPDYVKGKAIEAAYFLIYMAAYELALYRKAGVVDGTPCGFKYWLPGDGYLYSEDFCALVSAKHYREFFLEADTIFNNAFDSAYLHVHSGGIQCLPGILENPHLKGIELANDINNHDLRRLVEGAKLVQARGLPLQISSWEHPLETSEMEFVLKELDPRGLIVAFQARSQQEAWKLYRMIKNFR